MPHKFFISLPASNIAKSRAFYAALGWTLIENFSGEDSACFAASDSVYFMITSHAKFQAISPKPLILPSSGAMSLIALSCVSRAEVVAMTEAALAHGGRSLHDAEDEGFMYSRAFEDPDGNGFGPMWMDPNAAG
jgi:predicted lactoylglutathione lyase